MHKINNFYRVLTKNQKLFYSYCFSGDCSNVVNLLNKCKVKPD